MLPTKLTKRIEKVGDHLVEGFHLFALFVIGVTIVSFSGPQTLPEALSRR